MLNFKGAYCREQLDRDTRNINVDVDTMPSQNISKRKQTHKQI